MKNILKKFLNGSIEELEDLSTKKIKPMKKIEHKKNLTEIIDDESERIIIMEDGRQLLKD
jgi:hypothetical protein